MDQALNRSRNHEQCAVRSVPLITLSSKFRSDNRVLLTIYQHNNDNDIHHKLNLGINFSLEMASNTIIDMMQSIQPILNITVMLLSLMNVTK